METTSAPGSPISDSWLFIKSDENDIGKTPVATKSNEEMEDSDGISVISESEMFKNSSNQHSDSDEVVDKLKSEKDNVNVKEEPNLLTPPVTPNCNFNDEDDHEPENDKESEEENEYKKENSEQQLEVHQESTSPQLVIHNHGGVMLLAVMALIIALLYTNVSTLKSEMRATASIYEQRIAILEEENQILKAQLNELIKQLKVADQVRVNDEFMEPIYQNINEKYLDEQFIEKQEEALQQPITKDVWMGGEKEDVVKILDKKLNSLPDYCYFTDESDLFYEYNKENCERKKKKLDERVKKFREKNGNQKAESVDDIYKKPADTSYKEYMRQTTDELIVSLNDEIQDIKSSRISHSITDIDEEDLPYNPQDDAIIEKPLTKEILQDKKEMRKNKRKTSEEIPAKKQQKRQETPQKEFKKPKVEKQNRHNELKNQENNQDESKRRPRKRKQKGSEEWVDRRSMGREEARKKHEDDDSGENWFIKRKNDREIHRVEH